MKFLKKPGLQVFKQGQMAVLKQIADIITQKTRRTGRLKGKSQSERSYGKNTTSKKFESDIP